MPITIQNPQLYGGLLAWLLEKFVRSVADQCKSKPQRMPDKTVEMLSHVLKLSTKGGIFSVYTNVRSRNDVVQHFFRILRDGPQESGWWQDTTSAPPAKHGWALFQQGMRIVYITGLLGEATPSTEDASRSVQHPEFYEQLLGALLRRYGEEINTLCIRMEDADLPESTQRLPIVLELKMPGVGAWEIRTNARSPNEFKTTFLEALRHPRGMGRWCQDSERERLWGHFSCPECVVLIHGKLNLGSTTGFSQKPL